MKKKEMLFATAYISAFSFACKGIGMLFRLYLASRMGASGIGLYQLVMSVYALFTSFASAGYTVSVSRLAAEDMESASPGQASGTTKLAMRMAFISGAASAISLALLAPVVSAAVAGEGRTLMPLRILAFSMPFIAVSSCMKGYFMASRKAIVPASAQLFEELCKTGITVALLTFSLSGTTDTGVLCAGIAAGLTAGEVLSCAYLYVFYRANTRKHGALPRDASPKRILNVLFPVAAGSWLTSGLHAAENVLIPYCFALYGGGCEAALAEFGVIRGMAIPVLFFPFAFVSAFISILTPEISRLSVADRPARDAAVGRVFRLTSIISVAAGGVMFFFASEISEVFYRTSDAAHAIKLLALVTPFMYIETVCDGVLKSIGEQSFCMRVTLVNCLLRVAAVFLLIPRTGAEGYIRLLMISNTFSFFACAVKLCRKCRVRGAAISFVYPLCAAVFAGMLASFAASPAGGAVPRLCAGSAVLTIAFATVCLPLIIKNGHRRTV